MPRSVVVLPGRGGRLAPASGGERHAANAAIRTAILEKRPAKVKAAPAEAKAPKAEKAEKAPRPPKGEQAAGTEKAPKAPKAPKPPKAGKPE